MKLKILEGIPVSFPAIQVIGLCGDLVNDAGVVVVEVVVEEVVVVETLTGLFPVMNFVRLKGFFPLCLACP